MARSPLAPRASAARSACVGLLLALAPVPGAAQTATLIFPDVCDDPSAVFDYYWARQAHDANDLFLFKDANTISPVGQTRPFAHSTSILVIAHGNEDGIGGFPKAGVATQIHAAHPNPPRIVRFFTCSAAKGHNTVLKLLNEKYDGAIDRLVGSTSSCALTGNGSANLKDAVYRVSPERPNKALYDAIVDNITAEWAMGNYQNSGQTYQGFCRGILGGNLGDLPAFIANVFKYFWLAPVNPDNDPRKSKNYLELIKLNFGGTAPLQCGKLSDPCP